MAIQHRDISDKNILFTIRGLLKESPYEKPEDSRVHLQSHLFKEFLEHTKENEATKILFADSDLAAEKIHDFLQNMVEKVLRVGNRCYGTLIDGDMAINLNKYFDTGNRTGTITVCIDHFSILYSHHTYQGTEMFMATELRTGKTPHLQSPVDDFTSFIYVFLYVATLIAIRTDKGKLNDVQDRNLKQHHDKIMGSYSARDTQYTNVFSMVSIGNRPGLQALYGDTLAEALMSAGPWWQTFERRRLQWELVFQMYLQQLKPEESVKCIPFYLHFTNLCLKDFLDNTPKDFTEWCHKYHV
jgi:serine/threonine protein kinase